MLREVCCCGNCALAARNVVGDFTVYNCVRFEMVVKETDYCSYAVPGEPQLGVIQHEVETEEEMAEKIGKFEPEQEFFV